MKLSFGIQNIQKKSVIPENIYTHNKEGFWKFQGGRVSQAKCFKENFEPILSFSEGWGGGGR